MRQFIVLCVAAVCSMAQAPLPSPGNGPGGPTIPSVSNILSGNGSGGVSDSGIAAANVATQASNGNSGGVPCYTGANKALVSSSAGVQNALMAWGGAGTCPTSPLSMLVTNQNTATETWTLYNSTPTTGKTELKVVAGAGYADNDNSISFWKSNSDALPVWTIRRSGGDARMLFPGYMALIWGIGTGYNLGSSSFALIPGSSSIVKINSGGFLGWNNRLDNVYGDALDTTIGRNGAGVMCVGTSVTSACTGTLQAKNILSYDPTATTGVSNLKVREGAGQSTSELFGAYKNDGTTMVWSIINQVPKWGNAAEPTCNSTNRGSVVMVQGAAGVADTFRICGKSAADTYSYVAIATF